MIGFFIALLSGALMSVQGVFIAWGLSDRKNPLTILQVTPKYMLLGGVIGAFITFTVIKSMDALGPAKAVMLIVIAQLLAAYLIELAGIFGVEKADFSWRKVIGMAAAIVGVAVFQWE